MTVYLQNMLSVIVSSSSCNQCNAMFLTRNLLVVVTEFKHCIFISVMISLGVNSNITDL